MSEKEQWNEQSVSGEQEKGDAEERKREGGEAEGQVLLSAINTCNTTIDRRNQLLKATREERF